MVSIEGKMVSHLYELQDIEEMRIKQGIYQFFYDLGEDTTLTTDQ